MDRQIIYPGQVPFTTDLLNTNKNVMLAVSKLAAAILGTDTHVNGLACTPTSPASLQVAVGPGEIYSMAPMDATPYSAVAADAHPILKQGVALDPTLLTLTPPTTPGQSINYLVQAAYQEVDAVATVLPFYNSQNPAQAWMGMANNGQALPTVRAGTVAISLKAGPSAATGSQATPAPDGGCVGLYVVTVANGQTQINASNIAPYASAPFLLYNLMQLAPLASPALTGTPTAPTAASNDNSQQIATTAFVRYVQSLLAPLNSPALTGTPTAPTPAANDNSAKIATTAFVQALVGLMAPLNSPALVGTPTAPTAANGANNATIANTLYVYNQLAQMGNRYRSGNIAASRAFNAVYYNTSGYPMLVQASFAYTGAGQGSYYGYVGGAYMAYATTVNASYAWADIWAMMVLLVPPGCSYQITVAGVTGGIYCWSETC
jgi:hypothetical protein